MIQPARLSTLLIFALLANGLAAADDRSSSLKLVAKSNSSGIERTSDLPSLEPADAPDLSPKPPQTPRFGDDLEEKPFSPSSRRGAVAAQPYSDELGPEYPGDAPPYDDGSYGAAGPGGHLQRHADRVRSYIDNRPRQLPLQNESWLNRPYAMSYFVGGLALDNPIPGLVGGDTGITYGGRFSWDFAPKWGIETRLGGASVGVVDQLLGTSLSPASIFYADIDWLWYFTGDTRWRPFALIGTGLFDIDFSDALSVRHHSTVLQLPIGFGMKYRHSTRIAMRVDLVDNIGFASGQESTMHNWSLTAGIEARFGGGRKRNYWPWNPSRGWW